MMEYWLAASKWAQLESSQLKVVKEVELWG